MFDAGKEASRACDAIDELKEEVLRLQRVLESIADLARSADESNWAEATDKIFRLAYDNY